MKIQLDIPNWVIYTFAISVGINTLITLIREILQYKITKLTKKLQEVNLKKMS